MSYKFIIFQLEKGVAFITLNRPSVLNSFNRDMAKEVQDALAAVRKNESARSVLLTGQGRAFCAGQDLAEAASFGDSYPADIGDIVKESYNPIIRGIRHLEKPVVCAVNGVAAGAGANLALACDIVVASEKASFIQSFCHVGLIPDSGGTFFLPRLVGLPRAAAMMMLGEKISAAQAYEFGMIYKVFKEKSLMDEALRIAQHLALQPTTGLGLIKRGLNGSFANDLDTHLDFEEELQRIAGRTHDYKEGVRAFLEKRKPKFNGK